MKEKLMHTPGPWTAVDIAPSVRAADDQMTVCDIRGWGYLTGVGGLQLSDADAIAVQEANTRLIAAAPDLLAALREARRALYAEYAAVFGERAAKHPSIAACDEAISKAEGR